MKFCVLDEHCFICVRNHPHHSLLIRVVLVDKLLRISHVILHHIDLQPMDASISSYNHAQELIWGHILPLARLCGIEIQIRRISVFFFKNRQRSVK